MSIEKAKKLAEYEVGWWKAHHHKDFPEAFRNMTSEYVILYGITQEAAEEAVKYRIEAGKAHDEAERLEDAGNLAGANNYWKRTEELLQQHFEKLLTV